MTFNPDGPDGDMDESGPVFWETVYFFARRGQHLNLPRELELRHRVASDADTQLLPIIEGGSGR